MNTGYSKYNQLRVDGLLLCRSLKPDGMPPQRMLQSPVLKTETERGRSLTLLTSNNSSDKVAERGYTSIERPSFSRQRRRYGTSEVHLPFWVLKKKKKREREREHPEFCMEAFD